MADVALRTNPGPWRVVEEAPLCGKSRPPPLGQCSRQVVEQGAQPAQARPPTSHDTDAEDEPDRVATGFLPPRCNDHT